MQRFTAITTTTIPRESALRPLLGSADFADAYRIELANPNLTPVEIFLTAVSATPLWVDGLMATRNLAVRFCGLKDVGGMRDHTGQRAADYRVGERIGIFSIVAAGEKELVLGIDDNHLDVRVSAFKEIRSAAPAYYTLSTVVHIKNRLGSAYMAAVGFVHPFVVRAIMRRASVLASL